MMKRKIAVIGGGPAGLMAAGQAAESGAEVILFEKMNRPGLKLSITGKGRCNITNVAELSEFIGHFGKTGPFLRQAFSDYFTPQLVAFLESLGLELMTERGGRMFPASGKAADVVHALVRWAKGAGVRIESDRPVERVIIEKGCAVGVKAGGKLEAGGAVIIATGGESYPSTGSTGDGYGFARAAGHHVVDPRPALVPLETAGDAAQRMAGLNLRNVGVTLYKNGKKCRRAFGETVFAEFGVTGPVILTLSGEVVDAVKRGDSLALSIDFKAALNEKKLDERLLHDFSARGRESIASVLRGLLPAAAVPLCLEAVGIPPDRKASVVTAKERRKLREWLKDFRLEITGYRPFEEAIITAGGVDTKEIDPRTMESRLVKGLFFAGEVLDIQADTGGYNLQAAFSTGWCAGRSAAAAHR
ncbi:MAG: NAD(P)/FAD-dependent oxidoreductase [Syntrophales bacterium]|jgi:predicted Rossmann fold flavoprotein|nr:NAD(P)/FAD-dependent oxidoreductase [Syntrophales bacterium]